MTTMSRNPAVQSALSRIAATDPRNVQAARSRAFNIGGSVVLDAASGSTNTFKFTMEPGRIFEAAMFNAAARVTATGLPLTREPGPTDASNTATWLGNIDVKISTTSQPWQNDWMPLTLIAGSAGAPFWWPDKPVIGAGEDVLMEFRNRTGAAVTVTPLLIGMLHAI